MKIAFYSNFLNHHQLPLCQAFLSRKDVEFVFVATQPIEKERTDMGYEDMNALSFVLRSYESEEMEKRAKELAKSCDVMIFGSAPLSYLEIRMQENKLTFYFTERVLRKGYFRRFIPTTRKKIFRQFIQYKDKNLYVLGASAYTAYDLALCGFDKEKCFQWGYFPKIEEKNLQSLLALKGENEVVEILYAGRLLRLKRVMDTVKALKVLVKKGVDTFHFTIIGDGEQKPEIERYIKKHQLSKYVTIMPFTSPDNVRRFMDKADIYVFSSNYFEGWGAVVNEGMNSACAMVVSHAVGSAPYLIENGKNGILYPCGNVKALSTYLEKLVLDKAFRESLAKDGYQTITTNWTAEIAAERLLSLVDTINNNNGFVKDGVCSLAKPLKNNWIKRRK